MTEKKPTVYDVIKTKTESKEMMTAINAIAPAGFDINRHTINALNVVKNNLKDCNNLVPASVLNSVYNAAALGLSFNPMAKEAYLVPFNSKISNNPVTYGTIVTFIPGYKGLIKLCVNAGMKSMSAKVIFEKDRFVFNESDGVVSYEYSPSFSEDRGNPICVLTVAEMQDGTKDIKALPYHKVLEIKNAAKSQGGPWSKFEEEMAMKTAIRRHCNQLPQSFENPELQSAIRIDEMMDAGKPILETPEGMQDVIDADYDAVLEAASTENQPQSSKPVLPSMPVEKPVKEPAKKPTKEIKNDDTLAPGNRMKTLCDMTGYTKGQVAEIVLNEWDVRDVETIDGSTFSGIFDSFMNGIVGETK
jgi:phage RecT family recombinase